ncbi:hypothetical protein [Halioxenophilus sp. WMMB6]|uniref:hypothetical protein n=1 Tax=Halioxenophilus sp. WMMB6 TaxID=3073815 RepID=UPI00295E6C77|nr:hypothetical protein [Halioxenophilus sp. WMMB6]
MSDENNDDFDTDSDDVADSPADVTSSEISVDHSLAAKNREREELQKQIEEFLARGGKISQVDTNVCADPPQKPNSSYGSRPI